jgi:hypothetical protein
VYAWLSAEPMRWLIWLTQDSAERLKIVDDLPSGTPEFLPPANRAFFEAARNAELGRWPGIRTCAKQADDHWSTRVPGVVQPENPWGSFLGLYQAVYRFTSMSTHASMVGLNAVIRTAPGENSVIDMETASEQRAVIAAPAAFALGLRVATVAEGWPSKGALEAIFSLDA